MFESSRELCLVMVAPPEIEEKLLDVLLAAVGNEVFTSTPSFSHARRKAGSAAPSR